MSPNNTIAVLASPTQTLSATPPVTGHPANDRICLAWRPTDRQSRSYPPDGQTPSRAVDLTAITIRRGRRSRRSRDTLGIYLEAVATPVRVASQSQTGMIEPPGPAELRPRSTKRDPAGSEWWAYPHQMRALRSRKNPTAISTQGLLQKQTFDPPRRRPRAQLSMK